MVFGGKKWPKKFELNSEKTPNAMSGGRFDSGRARRGAARARARRVKTATRHGVRWFFSEIGRVRARAARAPPRIGQKRGKKLVENWIFLNIFEYFWIFWNILEYFGVFWSIFGIFLEYFWVFFSTFEYFWVFLSIFEYFWVFLNIFEYFWVFLSHLF